MISNIKSLGFSRADDLSEVPESPGVYAWYAPLQADHTLGLRSFCEELESNLEEWNPVTSIEFSGKAKRVSINNDNPDFDFDKLTELGKSLSRGDLETISTYIQILSFFREPFYIGKAKTSLRGRLQSHLQSPTPFEDEEGNRYFGSGTLSKRVAEHFNETDRLKQCFIAYLCTPLNNQKVDIPRLIEQLMLKLVRPSQNQIS